jgi:hypothetical protein
LVHDHSRGGGSLSFGCVTQPARNNNAPQKMNPEILNTRQFREMEKRTQADSIYDLRYSIDAAQADSRVNRRS